MSNQEQQFHTSENYPPELYPKQPPNHSYEVSPTVNADPREQQQQMMYGVPEYYGGQGEKLQPRLPQRRRRTWLFWLLGSVLIVIFIAGMSSSFSHSPGFSHFKGHYDSASVPDIVYPVSAPKFIINDNSGDIHIHTDDSGNANTVTIHISKSDNSEPDPIVSLDKGSGVITIKAVEQGFSNRGIDIDITTPATSDVQLNDGNGHVNIEGITGTINAQATQGQITANNVSGQVALSSINGDVSVDNGNLSGTSSLNSVNGAIHYSGSLDAQGSYKFATVNGDIDVTLPDTSALHIDANATHGRLDNEFGGNDVGSSPRASLTLQSENGSIDIHKNG